MHPHPPPPPPIHKGVKKAERKEGMGKRGRQAAKRKTYKETKFPPLTIQKGNGTGR